MGEMLLFCLGIAFIPIVIALPFMFLFAFCKKRGIAIERIVCNIIAFSPFILLLAENLFPAFFESWGFFVLIGLIVVTCAIMIHWKEDSHGIEAVCAFIAILYGANGFINFSKLNLSFSNLVESFCFIIAGIGCLRYMIRGKK